jgi:hypothetical protein
MSHKLLLIPTHGTTTEGVLGPLKRVFSHVAVENSHLTETGWPVSCNNSFSSAAWRVFLDPNLQGNWLLMEPDAIPLGPEWIDKIEESHLASGRLFSGDAVKCAHIVQGSENHMSGVAVYPANSPQLPSCKHFFTRVVNRETGKEYAWDIASAPEVFPLMAQNQFIHHDWVPDKEWRRPFVTRDFVRAGALVYHPDKCGVLMDDGLDGVVSGALGDPSPGLVNPLNHATPSSLSVPPGASTEEQLLNMVAELKAQLAEAKAGRVVTTRAIKEVKASKVKGKRGRPRKIQTP